MCVRVSVCVSGCVCVFKMLKKGNMINNFTGHPVNVCLSLHLTAIYFE